MKKLASLLLLVLASGSALAQGARPSDVASVDSIVAALYDTISGPAGKARDWERLRSLFRTDGRMVVHSAGKDGAINTRVLSLEDYITRVTPVFAKEGFYESELSRKGNMARLPRFSAPMRRAMPRRTSLLCAASTRSSWSTTANAGGFRNSCGSRRAKRPRCLRNT